MIAGTLDSMTLEHIIRRLAIDASPSTKARLRRQIINRIASPKTEHVLLSTKTVFTPSLLRMAELRAEILDRVANWRPLPTPLWQRFGKLASVATALLIAIRMAPMFFLAATLEASSQSILMPTKGAVSITDGAEWSTLKSQLTLDHPVTIRTSAESAATIVIRDDAVLRLGENTEITLREAIFAQTASSDPVARIAYGQLWVMSLLPEAMPSQTSIVLPQGKLSVRNGSVSLLADPEQSTVQVFYGFARVQPTGEENIHLMQSDQLTLRPRDEVQRNLVTSNMREEEWVQENFARDAAHRSEVASRRQELSNIAVGILPDSAFYFLKIASEQIDLGLTIGEQARREKQVQHAETRLHEAVALLQAGKKEEAKEPLAAYRDAIRAIASMSEAEAKELLESSILLSSTTLSDALPHSNLYPAKEAVIEAAAETQTAEIQLSEVDLYLLSDALLEIENKISQGNIEDALTAWNGIEGAVAVVIEEQRLGEIPVSKDTLKALKIILRSIAFSLSQAASTIAQSDHGDSIASLADRVKHLSPPAAASTVAKSEPEICMSVREITRRTNQFLAAVFTYQTPVGQRNAVLQQIALLPDCPQSGRILSKVMNKVPVFTRSFVWEALQKIGTGT